MVALIQNLPSEENCRIWRYENAQDKRFQRASLSRLCYGGNVIVSLQKYNCARKEMELRCPKEMLIFLLWEIQLPLLWKCKAGFCGQVCSRDLSPSYKDKWGQFSFCLLLDKRCYFLVPILKTQRNNFLFRILFIKHQEIKILLLSKYRTVVFFPQTPNKVYWRQYKSKVGPINKPRPSRIWNFTA